MHTISNRFRIAAATAAVAITVTLLDAVCAIADHGTAVQVAAARAAHPTLVASGR